MERAALLSRGSIACVRKRNLEEIIATASENNVRLRKKLDLIKYQREKVGNQIFFRMHNGATGVEYISRVSALY